MATKKPISNYDGLKKELLSGDKVAGSDLQSQMSITSDGSGLLLSGDAASPGNSKVYGTNASGTKAWKDEPARIIMLKLVADGTGLAIGDGKIYFPIPAELNGFNLTSAHAMVSTVSSSGTPTYQIHNLTDAQDMLTTKITIDANERTSYTAAAAHVVNTTYDDVATGDVLRIDKDVAGTGEFGDTIVLSFKLP